VFSKHVGGGKSSEEGGLEERCGGLRGYFPNSVS